MSNENTTKSCTNCKYFYQHYVINSNAMFSPTQCGHCTLGLLKLTTRTFKIKEDCDKWEDNINERFFRTQTLRRSLIDMEKHIKEIKQIINFNKK